jgi:hypothetical protein
MDVYLTLGVVEWLGEARELVAIPTRGRRPGARWAVS